MSFDPRIAADGIWIGVSFFVLSAVFQKVFVPALVDGLRDRLFDIRRDLFLLVAERKLAANDPAYLSLRRTSNAVIAFAERITFLRGAIGPLVAMRLRKTTWRAADHSHRRDLDMLAAIQDDDARKIMAALHRRTNVAIALHVFVSSPLAWVLVIALAPVLITGALITLIAGTIQSLAERFILRVSEQVECDVEMMQMSEAA
jgi:hypothetical protein